MSFYSIASQMRGGGRGGTGRMKELYEGVGIRNSHRVFL